MAKGQYRLVTDHYFPGDIYLVAGTLVGDETPYPVEGPPSFNMEPLDPEAKQEVESLGNRPKPEAPAKVNTLGSNPAMGPARGGPGLGQTGSGPKEAVAKAAAAAGIPDEEQQRIKAAEAAAAQFRDSDLQMAQAKKAEEQAKK